MSIMILMFNMSLPYRLSYRAYSWQSNLIVTQSLHENKLLAPKLRLSQSVIIIISCDTCWRKLKLAVKDELLFTPITSCTWRNLSASELFVLVDYMICTQLVIRLWAASAGITPSPLHSLVAPTIEHVLTRRNLLRRQVKDCD